MGKVELEWRPIDTAPKDGTPVLVNVLENIQVWGFESLQRLIGENVTIAAWLGTPGDAAELGWVTVATAFALIAGARTSLSAIRVRPTHWMPLPPPPLPREGQAALGNLVAALPLSTRARNVLKNQGFRTLDDLQRLAEMPDADILRWPKVGQSVLREIREVVAAALEHFGRAEAADPERQA